MQSPPVGLCLTIGSCPTIQNVAQQLSEPFGNVPPTEEGVSQEREGKHVKDYSRNRRIVERAYDAIGVRRLSPQKNRPEQQVVKSRDYFVETWIFRQSQLYNSESKGDDYSANYR